MTICLSAQGDLVLKNTITGISGPLLKNVQLRLTSMQELQGKATRFEQIREWYDAGPENIRKALEPYGYFSAQISGQLQPTSNGGIAYYQVYPGPPVYIRHIDLQISGPGAANPRFENFRRHLPIKIGAILLTSKYQLTKKRLFNIAHNLGFTQATLEKNEIQVNTITNSADIILHLSTGPRFYYGPVHFNDTLYSKQFLRRFLNIHSGQPYSPSKLLKLEQNMANSNYFQQVTVTPLPSHTTDYRVPVDITITPYKARQYLLGGGYGTDTGLRGTVGVNFRHITPTGHQFKALVQGSQKNSSVLGSYVIPGLDPLTEQYLITGSLLNDNPQQLLSQTTKLSFSQVVDHKVWQRTISLNVQRDKFTIIPDYNQQIFTTYPSISFLRIYADNPVRTKNGFSINGSLQGGLKGVGSQINFAEVQAGAKLIKSIFPGTRLILRTTLGATFTNNVTQLPLSMRFFAGGFQSIRGYDFQDLGPGTKLATGSAELQQRIFGDWYAGAFVDGGNTFDNFYGWNALKRSVGGSVIYLTAIGPFELSVARPLGDPTTKAWKIQFSMGPDL